MKYNSTLSLFALCFILHPSSFILSAHAQGTAFTYQGRLNSGTNPASGIYDLRFAIYDLSSGGTQQGNLVTNTATAVSNGLFTVALARSQPRPVNRPAEETLTPTFAPPQT